MITKTSPFFPRPVCRITPLIRKPGHRQQEEQRGADVTVELQVHRTAS
jgi:hypothetical protein